MPKKDFETDEDMMIYHYEVHRDMIKWVIEQMAKEGIPCERTKGSSPKGDILIIKPEDASRVKDIIRQIQSKYNR